MRPHIILTRPAAQSTRFGAEVSEVLGDAAEIMLSPLMHIEPLEFGSLPDRPDVIFTSENGVAGFIACGEVGARKAFCVGDRTAQAARDAGFKAYSAGGAAADLIDLIAREGGGEMIYARGAHVARDLRADLAKIGIPVTEVLVYAQNPLPLSDEARVLVQGATRVIFPLFSRRSMGLLAGQGLSSGTAAMTAVCISDGVAEAAPAGYFDNIVVCDAPNSRSMIKTLRAVIA